MANFRNNVQPFLLVFLFFLVTSSVSLLHTAADTTIQNTSRQPVQVNGRLLSTGQIITLQIQSGKGSGSVDLAHVRNVTGVQIRNGREYFVVDNRNATGFLFGRRVRTLDLVEGNKVQNSF